MNVREEMGAKAPGEAPGAEEREAMRRRALLWARRWREGDASCPLCGGTELELSDVESDESVRYETFRCKAKACAARWRVELREAALALVREGDTEEWLEYSALERLQPVSLSEREAAALLAALRYWRREGLWSTGHEREIETDSGRLEPLSATEFEALCARIARSSHSKPDELQR